VLPEYALAVKQKDPTPPAGCRKTPSPLENPGPVEMTILFAYSIPRFQERSAEPQIPPGQVGFARSL
jgi:hypothetical protein